MKAKLYVKTKGSVEILMKLLSQSQGNNSKKYQFHFKKQLQRNNHLRQIRFFLSEVFS